MMNASLKRSAEQSDFGHLSRKSAVEARSRKKRRDMAMQQVLRWTGYETDLHASRCVPELSRFLSELEQQARFPHLNEDSMSEMLHTLDTVRSKEVWKQEIRNSCHSWVPDDIITVKDHDALVHTLLKPFPVPILFRPEQTICGQSSRGLKDPHVYPQRHFAISGLVKSLSETVCDIDVFDCSVIHEQERTYLTSTDQLSRMFNKEVSEAERLTYQGLNFLDIENRTGLGFCPEAIIKSNPLVKEADNHLARKGKTNSVWQNPVPSEFFLLSKEKSLSTVHVDLGGSATWVRMLEGCKIWYWPRQIALQSVESLVQLGSANVMGHVDGWIKLELHEGDLLIMPPSFLHAVFTPTDCLAVGGQFYTAAHLPRSLRGLTLQEKFPEISNEDLGEWSYEMLKKILHYLEYRLEGSPDMDLSVACASYCQNMRRGKTGPQSRGKGETEKEKMFKVAKRIARRHCLGSGN